MSAMLTNQSQFDVSVATDGTTGARTWRVPMNPVGVITPMGPAPGELVVETTPAGGVSGLRAVLRPRPDHVGEVAPVLARVADFQLDPSRLQGLPADVRPVLTFSLRREALVGLAGVRVAAAADLLHILQADILGDVRAFTLTDLTLGHP